MIPNFCQSWCSISCVRFTLSMILYMYMYFYLGWKCDMSRYETTMMVWWNTEHIYVEHSDNCGPCWCYVVLKFCGRARAHTYIHTHAHPPPHTRSCVVVLRPFFMCTFWLNGSSKCAETKLKLIQLSRLWSNRIEIKHMKGQYTHLNISLINIMIFIWYNMTTIHIEASSGSEYLSSAPIGCYLAPFCDPSRVVWHRRCLAT
jgi:hypothetical protein